MARAAKKKAGKPGPKPRGPFADKRRTLTTRITDRTRQRLEDAAAATDRSLSQEIELRLERSFERGDVALETLGGPENVLFVSLLKYLFSGICMGTSAQSVWDRPQAFVEAEAALAAFFQNLRPALAGDARQRGCRALDGLDWLVHQALEQVRLWSGQRPAAATLRLAAEAALRLPRTS